MWYMNFLRILRQQFKEIFGGQQIGCGGPANWCAKTLDLLLWIFAAGTYKSLVFSAPINELTALL
jgi:hypothetical protein